MSKPVGFLSTYSVAKDPRTVSTQINDNAIVYQAKSNIIKHIADAERVWNSIDACSFEGRVLLIGDLEDENEVTAVVEQVKRIQGVKEIFNQLKVHKPRTMMEFTSDQLIKEKIETKMMLENDITTPRYKVRVHDGVVFVIGIYLQKVELDKVLFIASDTSGVKKVVNYAISISDKRRLSRND